VENVGAFEALKTSHQMIWKNWWAAASILSISLFIVMSASMLASGIIQIIFSGSLSPEELMQLMQFASLTVDKLVSPFFYAVLLLLYYELKGEEKPKNQDGFIA
jgi:membrane protein implicated in regulation of membrane protease activity